MVWLFSFYRDRRELNSMLCIKYNFLKGNALTRAHVTLSFCHLPSTFGLRRLSLQPTTQSSFQFSLSHFSSLSQHELNRSGAFPFILIQCSLLSIFNFVNINPILYFYFFFIRVSRSPWPWLFSRRSATKHFLLLRLVSTFFRVFF